jgi:hypothetical protein
MSPQKLTFSAFHLDSIIILLLFLNLPVDMVNGIFLTNGINLPMTVSQLYKLTILILIFFRLALFPGIAILIIGIVYGILFTSSIVQAISTITIDFLLDDFIKISKYLTPFIAFFYFQTVFKRNPPRILNKLIFNWIYFSYIVLAINILLKLLGIGYPMYEYGNIGTKGFFYAGNEISAILLILCSFIAYQIWNIKKNKNQFLAFLFFNVLLSVLITSKTAVLGVFLIFGVIAFNPKQFKLSLKRILFLIGTTVLFIPTVIYFAYTMIINSTVMVRIEYFWNKLDFMTFVFSSRNVFVKEMWYYYIHDYNIVQKIIGPGQVYYESKLGTIVEIDLLDIFFAYGIIGAISFLLSITLIFLTSYLYKKRKLSNPYGRLSYIMILFLTVISMFAGHIYSSGIGGFYIGFIFSIMFYQRNN